MEDQRERLREQSGVRSAGDQPRGGGQQTELPWPAEDLAWGRVDSENAERDAKGRGCARGVCGRAEAEGCGARGGRARVRTSGEHSPLYSPALAECIYFREGRSSVGRLPTAGMSFLGEQPALAVNCAHGAREL